MKTLTTIAALGVSLLMLSACGNGNNNPATAGAQQFAPGYAQCAFGQVRTQYGCLAQGACQFGMAQYNNTCIPAIQGVQGQINNPYAQCAAGQVYTQYGCLAQGACQFGMAQYNNTCIPAMNNANNGYDNGYNNGTNTGFNYQWNWNYNAGVNTGYNTGINNCQQGYLSTNYGCLPQANCGAGRVLFQNNCRVIYQNTYGGNYQYIVQ